MQEDFSLKGFVLHAVWLSRVYWLLCICTWDYARWEMHWLQFCGWKVQRRKVPCLEYKKTNQHNLIFQYFQPFCFSTPSYIIFESIQSWDFSLHLHYSFCLFFSTQIWMQKKIDKFSSATRSVLFSHFFILRKMHVKWTVGLLFIEMQSFVIFSCLSLARCHPR